MPFDEKGRLVIDGKVVAFDMDYFGRHDAFADVVDRTGERYRVWLGSKNGVNWITITTPYPGLTTIPTKAIIDTRTGILGGRGASQRSVRLNPGYITFWYYQQINNEGLPMMGYLSHDVGGKCQILPARTGHRWK